MLPKSKPLIRANIWQKYSKINFMASFPENDLYGVRPIVLEGEVTVASDILKLHFNLPERYPWGLPSFLDYTQPEDQSSRSHAHYRAIHLYVPFCASVGSLNVEDIGEIQIMTPQWRRIAEDTRSYYEVQKLAFFDATRGVAIPNLQRLKSYDTFETN